MNDEKPAGAMPNVGAMIYGLLNGSLGSAAEEAGKPEENRRDKGDQEYS